MMRATRLKSAGGAANYYGSEDYYMTGESLGDDTTWQGKGADALGLAGKRVTKDDLRSVLEGINPDREGPAMSKRDQFLRNLQAKEMDATKSANDIAQSGADMASADLVNANIERGDFVDLDPDFKPPLFEPQDPGALSSEKMPSLTLPKEGEPDVSHQAGWDFTFSAPKSVALAGILLGDDRLVEFHKQAVEATMAYAEEHHALSRKRDENGEIQLQASESLLYAPFHHQFSREGDVLLHTHAVTANHTIDSEGNHVALETTEMYKYQELAGYIYRSVLRDKIEKETEYKIRETGEYGFYELNGIDQKVIDKFSTARKERIEPNIEAFTKKHGRVPTEVEKNELLNKLGRPQKPKDGPEGNLDEQRSKLAKEGVTIETLLDPKLQHELVDAHGEISYKERANDYKLGHKNEVVSDLETSAAHALASVEDRSSVFHPSDVLKAASKSIGSRFDLREILNTKAMTGGEVLAAGKHMPRNVTTTRALEGEQTLLDQLKDNYGEANHLDAEKVAGFLTTERMERVLGAGGALNDGQKNAVVSALSSHSGIFLIQGYAGVGKTKGVYAIVSDIMKTEDLGEAAVLVRDEVAPAGSDNAGLGPTHRSVDELTKAGIEAQTLASFLNQYKGAKDNPDRMAAMREKWAGKTLFNDEVSMMGMKDMITLHDAKDDLGINKLIHTGDSKQIAAQSAGAPFRLMQNAGAPMAHMDVILRQNSVQEREGIKRLANGEIKQAFQLLNHTLNEVKPEKKGDNGPIVKAAIQEWADKGKDDTVILVTTHALRGLVNKSALAHEREAGNVDGHIHKQEVYRDKGLSDKDRQVSTNYKPGDYLVFHTDVRRWNFKKDESFKIIGIDHNTQRMSIAGPDGKRYSSTIGEMSHGEKTAYGVFSKEEIEVQPGVKMMWDRSDKDHKITNGETFNVTDITSTHLLFTDEKGEARSMPLDSPNMNRMSYGYGRTIDSYQGGTAKNGILVAPVRGSGEHTNLARIYVGMSRHQKELTTLTDDISMFHRNLGLFDGQNHIALEHVEGQIHNKGRGLLEAEQRSADKGIVFGSRENAEQARVHVRTGTVVKMDVQPFRGKQGAEPTFLIHYQNADGKIETLWSNKLSEIVKELGVEVGDKIQVESRPIKESPEIAPKDKAKLPQPNDPKVKPDSMAAADKLKPSQKDNRDWKISFHEKGLNTDKTKEIGDIPMASKPKDDLTKAKTPVIQPQRPGPSM